MAELLTEAYDGSLPVLFEGAFANSDPELQTGMYLMLQKASEQGLQVILLTCDPERSQAMKDAGRMLLGNGDTVDLFKNKHSLILCLPYYDEHSRV